MFAGLVLIAGAVGWDVVANEHILAQGRVVRLELAPVDPRSLMQGDFMALDYSVGRAIRAGQPDDGGYAVLRLDGRSVGRFVRVQPKAEPLASDEVALRFRVGGLPWEDGPGPIRFATNAFFFEEGTGERYEQARFGEFRVSANGEPRLTALLDADLHRLGEPLR